MFEYPVKITLKKPILHDAVFFEFAIGVCSGHFSAYSASILQHLAVSELKKCIQSLGPVFHGHRDFALCPFFGEVEVGVDNATQGL